MGSGLGLGLGLGLGMRMSMASNHSVIASYAPERTCNRIHSRLQPYSLEAATVFTRGCKGTRSAGAEGADKRAGGDKQKLVGVISRERTFRPRWRVGTYAFNLSR